MKLVRKNPVATIVFFMSMLVFLTSCTDSTRLFKCDADIDLGFIELTNETKSYFPYTGNEKIVLKNQKNEEITLVKTNTLKPIETEVSNTASVLCNEGFFDKQVAFFITKLLDCTFENKGTRQMSFSFIVYVDARGQSKANLGICDYMKVDSRADSTKSISFSKYSQFRGDTTKRTFFSDSSIYPSIISFASDTTISNKNYKNVITTKNTRHSVSIAQGKGLIAMKFDDELWVVDRIE